VIAGLLTESDQKNLRGLPGIGRVPGVGNRQNQAAATELLVVVTPHVVRARGADSSLLMLQP
jgi:Flp pilus assembly secretin CpaC